MYQFYYSQRQYQVPDYKQSVADVYKVDYIRPTKWEEHCLECSAPLCFKNCVHYEARVDGRCKRFYDGIAVYQNEKGCCGQGMRVKFRKWANMMTIIFPAMLSVEEYKDLTQKNQILGNHLHNIAFSSLPLQFKWNYIRTREYLRRRKLRHIAGVDNKPDAFIFHGFSFNENSFNLIVEVYDVNQSIFKNSLPISLGENLLILPVDKLDSACWKDNCLIKIYPEDDIEAELDILWCDFVKGTAVVSEKPADKVKCVVWDLDNTLWDGILIETDNPQELKLKPYIKKLIETLDQRGIIQSIASKNDFEPAWNVIEGLGLGEYFLYPQIHWNAKSDSLRQIAKSLNIGIDTFALVDDSSFERNQVSTALPQVRVYDPTEEFISGKEFDVPVTEESKNRRLMYKAEEKRDQIMASDDLSTVEFLKKCQLHLEIFTPTTDEEIERCYELVVRTNQLNMSGKKYSVEEFERVLCLPGKTNFSFSCADIYGGYGIVGFGQYGVNDGVLTFSEFAMSCRIAGKYVESALFSFLLKKENCKTGVFEVVKTKKNTLLRKTLEGIGFIVSEEKENSILYIFTDKLDKKELVSAINRR